MRFIDRESELARLDALTERHASGLVVIWGRRRVGKSRLLRNWCMRHDGVYTVADQSSAPVQRRYMAEALSEKFPGFNDAEYPGWHSFFRRLSRDARALGWKGPLVLDEFPYLAVADPSLPSVLQNWVDQESSSDGLLVAIAGSSQRMMQGLVLDANAPLYGRALEAFPLQPLPPSYIACALGIDDPSACIQAYNVWGGIPRYWELAEPFGTDIEQAMDCLVLDPGGPLHREPDRLLMEEIPPAVALRPLLDVIGNGVHRVSEIAGRLQQPATSLSRPLMRLVETGFVTREIPFGESENSSRRTLYRIDDPSFRFWFRVVAPHRAALATVAAPARMALWKRYRAALLAQTWEAICRNAISGLAHDDHAKPIWQKARRWWHGRQPEWDMVVSDLTGEKCRIGEAKWSDSMLTNDELAQETRRLRSRPLPPGLPSNVEYALFVPSVKSNTPPTMNGVRIYDAAMVLAQR